MPSSAAPRTFSGMPPTGPTVPSGLTVPVMVIVGVERLAVEQRQHGDGLERTGARTVDRAADLELVATLERGARQQRGDGDRAPGGGAALVAEAADLVLAEVDPQRCRRARGRCRTTSLPTPPSPPRVKRGRMVTSVALGGMVEVGVGEPTVVRGLAVVAVVVAVVVSVVTSLSLPPHAAAIRASGRIPAAGPTDALVHDHLSWFLLRSAPRRRRAGRLAATRHDGPEDSGSAAASL